MRLGPGRRPAATWRLTLPSGLSSCAGRHSGGLETYFTPFSEGLRRRMLTLFFQSLAATSSSLCLPCWCLEGRSHLLSMLTTLDCFWSNRLREGGRNTIYARGRMLSATPSAADHVEKSLPAVLWGLRLQVAHLHIYLSLYSKWSQTPAMSLSYSYLAFSSFLLRHSCWGE